METTVVLMCADALDRRFRFGYTRPLAIPLSDPSLRALPPDEAHRTDGHRYDTPIGQMDGSSGLATLASNAGP